MKRKTLLAVCIVLILTCGAFLCGAAAGSSSDPLVSKSYVDSYVDGKTTYETVQISAGKSIIGGAGCEIILRAGEAVAIGHYDAESGIENGVSDVTAGADLFTGTQVQLNHLLLTPRDDGRGLKATTSVWVMVRGEYTIK